MAKQGDDLEAVRAVAATLEPFGNDERERIIRWAREKLGMSSGMSPTVPAPALAIGGGAASVEVGSPTGQPRDIKTFIDQKRPKSDQQLVAVVAYFYQFVAPATERKDTVTPDDLVEACRVAGRQRPASAKQTLLNAFRAGYLDRADRGHYRLNSVGENLVAMALPDTGDGAGLRAIRSGRGKTKAKTRRPQQKKPANKPRKK